MLFPRTRKQQVAARRKPTVRPLRFESLEDRRMLSGRGLELAQELFASAVMFAPGRWDIGEKLKLTVTPETLLDNANSADTNNADQLRSGGGLNLELDGSGVIVGIWDGGSVRDTHDEFEIAGGGSRVTIVDTGADVGDHPTHVAGTIGAKGDLTSARGMAPNVTIRSRDSVNDSAELAADAGVIDLSNHSYGHKRGWLLEAHTIQIGLIRYPVDTWVGDRDLFGVENAIFGKYEDTQNPIDAALGQSPLLPSEIDQIAFDNPNLLSVWSAGNERNEAFLNTLRIATGLPIYDQFYVAYDGTQGQFVLYDGTVQGNAPPASDGNGGTGYDSLPQSKVAKNNLVVGAIRDITDDPFSANDVVMTSFSSWGPTDDGRIKPDVVANGYEVRSTVAYVPDLDPNATPVPSDTHYDGDPNQGDLKVWNGTSLAAPSVTGTAAMVVEHYRNVFDADSPRSATMRGLLIHTAFDVTNDAANVGPDYSTGWGLVDAAAAAEFLTGAKGGTGHTTELFERTYDGNEWTHSLRTDGGEPLKVTIVWTDPAPATLPGSGLDDSTSVLVNDLDLWITDESNTTLYRPWNLDPANPSAAAVRPVENVDPPPAEDNRNHRDNVEQVLIDAPASGEYIIHVGRTGSTFNQDYSLLVSGADLTAPVLSLTAPLATEVEWTWPDAVGENDYLVYKYDGGSVYLATLAANSTSYTATVLTPGASQNFMVVARNSLGNTNSGWQQINTPALLKPTVTLVEIAPGSVRVNWTDSNGESKFFLYRGDVDVNGNPANWAYQNTQSSGVGPRSFTFSGLTLEKEYAFQVKAVGGPNDTTAKSDPQIIETSKANTPVLALTPLTPTSVKLVWVDATGEDNYHIYRFNYDENEVPQGSTFLGTFAADMITYTATGLDTDRLVEFQVKAIYPSSSVKSARVTLVTPKLNEPVVTVTVESATQVRLNWDDSSGETSYYIYRFDYDQTGATGNTLVATPGAGVLTYTDSNLNADWYYEYQVKAVYPGSTVNSDRVAARTPAALLLAEADRVQEPEDPTTANDERLAALVVEAIRRWAAAGIDPLVVARLEETEVRIENLPEDFLGLAYSDSGVIILDNDAAGRGWFIDPTPAADEEFSAPSRHAEMIALAGGPADDAVDLLTVVMHEMGHVLGFGHEGGHYSMSESLASGLRRLPHFDEPVPIYDLAL